jgi:hypothetical protein
MAKFLDYIRKKVDNLQDTLKDEDILRKEDLLEVTRYVSRNTDKIYGGSTPYYNTQSKFAPEGLIKGTFGISQSFLQAVKDEADKQSVDVKTGKDGRLPYFLNKNIKNIGSTSAPKYEKEIQKVYEKLYSSSDFKEVTEAFCNLINYQVLSTFSLLTMDDDAFEKINTSLKFSSLPYGNIPTINSTSNNFSRDDRSLEILNLCTRLYPVNPNFTDIDVDSSYKIFKAVVNKDEQYTYLQYHEKISKARGYIDNETLGYDLFPSDDSCKYLSLETETDKSYFTTAYYNTSQITKEATQISVKPITSSTSACSKDDLNSIQSQIDFVSKLSENTDFEKVNQITGKELLNQMEGISRLSRNFIDVAKGIKTITSKLVFNKKKDVFANVRCNDLYFAVSCATYNDSQEDVVDVYFRQTSEGKGDIFIVNQNKKQFGYVQTILETSSSNCSTTTYLELLQPTMSIREKYELFTEQNVRPILLQDGMVQSIKGLEDAELRQSYLLTIEDKNIFYDLFIRNVMAYVYSYANQVEKKSDDGKTNKLVWVTNKNDEWGKGVYEPNKRGQYQWSDPNYYYIYDVRETFWMSNQDMTIKEVLAFFISKGGSRYDNSSYYRKLCFRILGVDYQLFAEKLIPTLLSEGLLCIEDLDFDETTQALRSVKYEYKYNYIIGNVYAKLKKLNGVLSQNIYLLYGQNKGAEIIDRQETLLENAKPTMVTFGNKEKALNLTLSIHNPILFNERKGYVSRLGENLNIFNQGKTGISSSGNDKYKTIEIDPTEQSTYSQYSLKPPFGNKTTKNHLFKFFEYMKFGSGGSKIGKTYITENYIVDGYIFPLSYDEFISKYLLKSFTGKIEGSDEEVKLPLSFITTLPPKSKVFTRTNVVNEKSKIAIGNSFLSKKSRVNLQKAGFISKDAESVIKETQEPTGTLDTNGEEIFKTIKEKYLIITEQEGKRIFDTIVAKYNKLESEIKSEGDRLFTLFCQTKLEADYRKKIEKDWNSTYNSMAVPKDNNGDTSYSKFPIFCEHSRWFGELPKPFLFGLREAQVEGMKFSVANKNSGLLAHEVGFGKTTTSIAMMSHMILTGESPRTIVFTPNQVFEKFYDEITGRQETGVLGLLGNWETPFPVMKLGNASSNTLIGKISKGKQVPFTGLKDYSDEEINIIEKWKDLTKKPTKADAGNNFVNLAKNTLSALRRGQPKFFPKEYIESDESGRIDERIISSDANLWLKEFLREIEIYIPEVKSSSNINSVYQEMVDVIKSEVEGIEETIELEIDKYKKGVRYNKSSITNPDVPPSVKSWWAKNKTRLQFETNFTKKLNQDDYPRQNWVSDIDAALKDGVINEQYANQLKYNQKQGIEWEGVLSSQGWSKITDLEKVLSNRFYSVKEKTGQIIRLLNTIQKILVDNLGKYKEQYKTKNQIILCNHGAISRFRVSDAARNEAKKFVSNVDDVEYVQNNINKQYDNLALKPLSLTKLNVTGVVVDEIHNFNNLISKPRTQILGLVAESSGGGAAGGDYHLLPTAASNAMLTKSPQGDSINIKTGREIQDKTIYNSTNDKITESSYKIKFNSTGKGSLKTGPTNLLAIVMEIKNNSKLRGVQENNTIMMSATPFTDNVFQMFTVFGFTNREMLAQSNMDKVFDFFITFVKEEWRFNITHQNQFGLFAEIQGYYNTYAMSNFITNFANFKVSDKIIEESRPLKYLIPQEKKGGANSASVQYSDLLEDVESYIELSDVQKEIISKLAEFVEGKSNSAFTICPNYGDAVKTSDEGELTFANEDVELKFKEVQKLLRRAKKESDDIEVQDELLGEAKDIIDELRDEYPKDKRITFEQDKIYTLLYDDVAERDNTAFITSEDDISFLALDEEDKVSARAIIGQSKGQACVISPYLLPCDAEGLLENDLLKDFPLSMSDMSLSAKNFVEQSPKIKYAVECALNSIKYDANNTDNLSNIGGQIIYLDRGKNFRYGGGTYNAYNLIKQYITDREFSYYDTTSKKSYVLKGDEIAIITGGMSGKVKVLDKQGNPTGKSIGRREYIRDEFNNGNVKILLGSSAIKEGIDLNRRAHTLYILDSDFSPSNAMQLEGRIWRQKNAWKYVRIVYVLGRDSIDAFVYSKLQQKIGEIKKMLESGVYELNKTQFTINAKDRIRKIISDVNQLAELEWQDETDELNEKLGVNEIEKSKLINIKKEYVKVKEAFDIYVLFINRLYSLLEDDAIERIAKEYKLDQDILNEHRHRLKGAKEGEIWRRDNPFVSMTLKDAKEKVRIEVENGDIDTGIPFISLNSNSEMDIVNTAYEKVFSFVKSRKNELSNIIGLNPVDRENLFKSSDLSQGAKLAKELFSIKKWVAYEELERYINLFSKGSNNESVMSDYFYLVINNTDEDKEYDYENIDILITQKNNEVNDIQNLLDNERDFKEKTKVKIKKEQEITKKKVGADLDEQILKFQKSMKLLEWRKTN